MTIQHTETIEWPNGKGYTMCSPEYAAAHEKLEALRSEADDSHEHRLRIHEASDILDALMHYGHLGQATRY